MSIGINNNECPICWDKDCKKHSAAEQFAYIEKLKKESKEKERRENSPLAKLAKRLNRIKAKRILQQKFDKSGYWQKQKREAAEASAAYEKMKTEGKIK